MSEFQEDDKNSQNIDLSASLEMNEQEQALFLNIQKSKSQDSFLGRVLPGPGETYNRTSLVWEPPETTGTLIPNIIVNRQKDHIEKNDENDLIKCDNGVRVFKKIKKQKIKGKCDYEKNICGYITKKIIREFIGKSYEKQVSRLCNQYRCSYKDCKAYYLKKIEIVTGPSHIPQLLIPQPNDQKEYIGVKQAFKQFYGWFLKQRYLRYLILQGKMTNKQAYIEYKNNNLFRFIDDSNKKMEQQKLLLSSRMKSQSKSSGKYRNQIIIISK